MHILLLVLLTALQAYAFPFEHIPLPPRNSSSNDTQSLEKSIFPPTHFSTNIDTFMWEAFLSFQAIGIFMAIELVVVCVAILAWKTKYEWEREKEERAKKERENSTGATKE
jgi:membrane protein CcdC involved in cytochrome C biogenesis